MIDKAVKHNLCGIVDYSDNGITGKQLIINSAGNITLFSFDSGQALSEHTARFDAMVQILEGEADIVISGQSNVLKAGECIVMPADAPHALHALSRTKMLLVMMKG